MENVFKLKIPTMLTIKEAAQRTGVAAHFVRNLVLNNKIVHVRCGRKYLVNLEKFVDYLNSTTGDTPAPEPENKFKIMPVRA